VFSDKATSDWVGPRDPDSNMRLIRFHVPPDETALEKEYRLLRVDTQNWHHEFWSKHNRNFFKVFRVSCKSFLLLFFSASRQLTVQFLSCHIGYAHFLCLCIFLACNKRGHTNGVRSKHSIIH